MANEAVLIFETEIALPFTCANATGIEKGATLSLSDPMTAGAVTLSSDGVAGIAAEEKIASDGRTKIGVYRGGIFKVTASGGISVGEAVAFTAHNHVTNAIINHEQIAGYALETATDAETFLMELKPGHRNLA